MEYKRFSRKIAPNASPCTSVLRGYVRASDQNNGLLLIGSGLAAIQIEIEDAAMICSPKCLGCTSQNDSEGEEDEEQEDDDD